MSPPNWGRIRAHYRHNEMAIHKAGASEWGVDPYAWDDEAGIRMSPIEAALWCDIRAVGAVLYPQYPVGRRFVDFGSPAARVAIECDGAAWHTDAKADAQRQREIEALGWTVYRITGRDCNNDGSETTDEQGRIRYIVSPAYRVVQKIAEAHGIRLWSPEKRIAA
jgi:very-short-patch-repair endonuclease